jgi:2-amino-4-hydroxy-6-hydroxymethyldihydropteridine diphosphokinase
MILIGLGSSLPFCGSPPQDVVTAAIRAIDAFAGVERVSRFYGSPAWPDPADPPFVNAVISVGRMLAPNVLLDALQGVEMAFGRRRGRRNAPRTLDLDLLAHGRIVAGRTSGARLDLPHPRIAERDFVLAPLCDIAPDWICPVTGRTARKMLGLLKNVSAVPLGGRSGRFSGGGPL